MERRLVEPWSWVVSTSLANNKVRSFGGGGGFYVDKMEYAKVKRLKIDHVFTLGKLFPQSLFNAIKHLQHCVF